MRSLKLILTAALVLAMGGAAYADLQSVTVDGSLRIRGNYFHFDSPGDTSFVEQRTRLGVHADFTDYVTAYIELDSYDNWGEDFRSNWVTGADFRGGADVAMYQAYIQAAEMWGTPLQLRIGRQELAFGSQWLLGVNDNSAGFRGLSYDAVRATYGVDMFSIDLFWAKLAENFGDFSDDDTDLYGLYSSYLGIDNHVFDLYWVLAHEDNSRAGLGAAAALFGLRRGDEAHVHTVGARGAGTVDAFDYEAEFAWQSGEIGRNLPFPFRRRNLDYEEFGANLEIGYTFDIQWTPRAFLGFAYFGGGDVADRGGLFRRSGSELAFNRMFSNWEYTEFNVSAAESNMLVYRGGISAAPTESLDLSLLVSYFQVDEEWENRSVLGRIFGWDSSDDDLGLEVGLYADYQYSSDLVFRAGYAHFFGGDALGRDGGFFRSARPGNIVLLNGTAFTGADEDDDYDYLFLETEVRF